MNNDRMDRLSQAIGCALLLVGALAGSLALLFLTERGGRARESMRGVVSEAGHQVSAGIGAAVERAKTAAEHGREYVESTKEQLTEAYTAGRERLGRREAS